MHATRDALPLGRVQTRVGESESTKLSERSCYRDSGERQQAVTDANRKAGEQQEPAIDGNRTVNQHHFIRDSSDAHNLMPLLSFTRISHHHVGPYTSPSNQAQGWNPRCHGYVVCGANTGVP